MPACGVSLCTCGVWRCRPLRTDGTRLPSGISSRPFLRCSPSNSPGPWLLSPASLLRGPDGSLLPADLPWKGHPATHLKPGTNLGDVVLGGGLAEPLGRLLDRRAHRQEDPLGE